MVERHVELGAGQITPTPDQRNACDVNGDSTCSAADAALIRCYIVKRTWTGCGSNANASASLLASASNSNVVRIGLGAASAGAGQTLTVPLTIQNGADLAGGTFTFQYDPNQLTFEAASLTSLTNGFTIQSHVAQPGLLRVALARNTAIAGDGTILQLRFAGSGNAASLRIAGANLNDSVGRDYATSALQKQIEIVTRRTVFLPIAMR